MSRLRSILIFSAILCTLLAPLAISQNGLPFTIQVSQDDTVTDIGDGNTATMAAPGIGLAATATFTFTYTGTTATTIEMIELTGSNDFSINSLPTPFPLATGETFGITTRYLPTVSDLREGLISIQYTAEDAEPTMTVVLNGTAPEFAYSYTPQGGNASQIAPGGTVAFPDTAVDATTTATFVVSNVGTAAGTIAGISIIASTTEPKFGASPIGPDFTVTGLPLLPTDIATQGTLSFTINFTPEQLGAQMGKLDVTVATGPDSFNLEGTGVGALFTYEIIDGDQATPIQPGQVIPLGDTLVNDTKTVLVRTRNTGNTEGVISTITASGDAYSVSDLPFLPATVQPDGSVLFSMTFAPTTVGQLLGRLKIGADEFDLIGNGVGSFLEYSTTTGGISTPVVDKGAVIFAPAQVGGSSNLVFGIKNAGTTATTITSISLGATGSAFALSGLPPLPVTLQAGGSTAFQIAFEPAIEGLTSVSLVIDTATFTLTGTGTPPSPLPGYVFDGASGSQEPASQPTVGLTFSETYGLKVVGTLTLNFSSEAFSNDPSVQFATGGRTVTFEVPAGATEAIFPNGTNRIKVQTGTVAGVITLTPSFATMGGADLTPASPAIQTMSIVEGAPVITNAVITSKNPGSMTVQVTGFSTIRSVTNISLSFASRAGENVTTTSLSLDAGAQFAAWYLSSQSKQFGSLFTATIPLNFAGSTNDVVGLTNSIQSITVTLSSAQGASETVTIPIPESF